MLQELSIQNFAIIRKLNLTFNDGMTVLTGETGAGKSIIIDAVGLLTGGRGSQDFIREGADRAILQGLYDIPENSKLVAVLDQYGIILESQQLLIHRELQRNGRNVIRVNGTLVNTTILRRIGLFLVDIHGQNEHQELMHVDRHRVLLDEFGKQEIEPLLQQYQAAYDTYRELEEQYHQRLENEQEWAQRYDMLSFQAKELAEADLHDGEEAALEAEYQALTNFQDVLEALSKSYEALAGDWDGNGLETVSVAVDAMEDIEELTPTYQVLTEQVRGAYFELQEASTAIQSARDNLEFDAERLQFVEDRLNLIRNLERKYGVTIADVLTHQSQVDEELAQMIGTGATAAELADQVAVAQAQAQIYADELTAVRQAKAGLLAEQIHLQLKDLVMDKAIFSVHFDKANTLTSTGQDDIEFYIQTNPGETAKPLVKIASGGELSRMMLAMKTIFSKRQGITSIIFDEVDTGVSGRVAQAIAEKIAMIAENSQVLTITHLPQVAAIAATHLYIEKNIVADRTETSVRELTVEERVDEVARMLSGSELTAAARQNARDLLKI
ncbi:DNA repair protein RecN [Weissella soli]|uniref:DNA repair protein RecN n=1 Tax=Weissella soli TaxID=155866 RepID=A0A288QY97_9LACO|nr:DNA repair protein RecN [Weissella soli]AOT56811.1 DNA repair protein RecN [Weissella soli]MCT8395465.1 DNA repair protein RecN [Weissella soli]NKY83263.1 DNA repair protein RecN [Weissella soli]RDL05446.1 DNA repair protein RecN (Recombination protein N) [Weissella soli]GEN93513.1 DNA repair protein RecN [Weissella soli]